MQPEACASFSKYKAVYPPRCNCTPCWDAFFKKQVTRYYTACRALDTLGERTVRAVHGEKYVKHLLRFRREQE